MRDSVFSLVSSVLLGIGGLCMYTGYDTQSLIVEPMLFSVYNREPDRIIDHAGYYGQALVYFCYMLMNLVVPTLLNYLSSTRLMALGCTGSTIYMFSFMYPSNFLYFPSCVCLGIGMSCLHCGFTQRLTEISTRETIARNFSIAWSALSSSMIFGCCIYLVFASAAAVGDYRDYSDMEIRYVFGLFAAFGCVGVVLFLFLPTRQVNESVASSTENAKTSFMEQLRLIGDTMTDRRMLMVSPTFFYIGLFFGVLILVYPTTLIYTKSLSQHTNLPAFFALFFALGDMFMGLIISILSKHIRDFGQIPTVWINMVLQLLTYILIGLSTPEWSTNTQNDEPALLIQPNLYLAMFIAFLFGMGDSTSQTVRTVMASLLIPERRPQCFALMRFYQCMSMGILFFISPFFSIYHYTIAFSIFVVLMTFNMNYYFRHIHRREDEERKQSMKRSMQENAENVFHANKGFDSAE